MEIVSSAPSQPVVPIVELNSDDEMDKPHESNDDDEEESGPFVQTEIKPLKLPSGVVIKIEKDHKRLEEEKRARRIARRAAREAKEKEMTDAVDFLTSPSTSSLPTAVPLHVAQQTETAAGDRRGDDRREAATGMDVDIVASTQEPPASIMSGAAGHRRGDDTL